MQYTSDFITVILVIVNIIVQAISLLSASCKLVIHDRGVASIIYGVRALAALAAFYVVRNAISHVLRAGNSSINHGKTKKIKNVQIGETTDRETR